MFKEKLYFRAHDGSTGYELWVSDGTKAGTKQVKDINPGSAQSSPVRMAAAPHRTQSTPTLFFDRPRLIPAL